MGMIIDEKYRINLYLDTNILVDYSEKKFPRLTESINYLAQSEFVNLRSSHFVLFEYSEVRKANLFRERLRPMHKWRALLSNFCHKKREENKAYIKQRRWKVKGKDYFSFDTEIACMVNNEVAHIKDDLNIDFDEHVLHPGLVSPTIKLCLNTKLSKEDCLVIISSVLPRENEPLSHCVLLSRDSDMFRSFQERLRYIIQLFQSENLSLPDLIKSSAVNNRINLYKNTNEDINECWCEAIKYFILKNNRADFIGRTYKFGNTGNSASCVYFELDNKNDQLKPMSSLFFISKDLSWAKIVKVNFSFWNYDGEVILPHSNPSFPKYSFKPSELSPDDLALLRKEGSLVFYAYD